MSAMPILRCHDLSCGYAGALVLHGIDFAVAPGEIVTVLGGSGTGKSTLLKTAIGLLRPAAGTVELFGLPLYRPDGALRSSLLSKVGMVFQRDALFGSVSLLENLLLPLRELTRLPAELARQLARAKLALVHLEALQHRLPGEVSGGQSKRVALARATMLDPSLLLCDEPTSGLDPVVAAQIDRVLLQFRDTLGVAIVAVTHDVASVQTISDRVILLRDGAIYAQGTVSELELDRRPPVHDFFHRLPTDTTRSQVER
jgi:phospholipid/cholesterol/gamma-HCH transport system ATP-binding protein